MQWKCGVLTSGPPGKSKREYILRIEAALCSPAEATISDMINTEKSGYSTGHSWLSDPDFFSGVVEEGLQLGHSVNSLSSARLVDPAGADQEQLQENEDQRLDQVKGELILF